MCDAVSRGKRAMGAWYSSVGRGGASALCVAGGDGTHDSPSYSPGISQPPTAYKLDSPDLCEWG